MLATEVEASREKKKPSVRDVPISWGTDAEAANC